MRHPATSLFSAVLLPVIAVGLLGGNYAAGAQALDADEPCFVRGPGFDASKGLGISQYSSAQTPLQANVPHTFVRKIVAIGDLHGDLENARKAMRMAGVIDASDNWTGAVDFFVQTGDILDRGNDTIRLYALMEKLRAQAKHAGGTVLSHFGNHEFMNLQGSHKSFYFNLSTVLKLEFLQVTGGQY